MTGAVSHAGPGDQNPDHRGYLEGNGVSLCFSSSCEGLWRRVGGPVGLAVSEHGEQDIDSAPGSNDQNLWMALGGVT